MTNPHYSGTHTRRVITILKVIRAGGWMTRDEVIERLRMTKNGDQHKLLAVLHDEGLLDCRPRARAVGQTGPSPREYRVAREWRDG